MGCSNNVNDSTGYPSPQINHENTINIDNDQPIYRPPPPYTSPNDAYYTKLGLTRESKDAIASCSFTSNPANNPASNAIPDTVSTTFHNTTTSINCNPDNSRNLFSLDNENHTFNISLVNDPYSNPGPTHEQHHVQPVKQNTSSLQPDHQTVYNNLQATNYPAANCKTNGAISLDIDSNPPVQSIQYVHTSPQQYNSYFSSMPHNYMSSSPNPPQNTSVFSSPLQSSSSSYPPGYCFSSTQPSNAITPAQYHPGQQHPSAQSTAPTVSQYSAYPSPGTFNSANYLANNQISSHNSSISTPSPQNSVFSSQQSPEFTSSPQQSSAYPPTPTLYPIANSVPSTSYSQAAFPSMKNLMEKSPCQQNLSLVQLLSAKPRFEGPYPKVNYQVPSSDDAMKLNENKMNSTMSMPGNYTETNHFSNSTQLGTTFISTNPIEKDQEQHLSFNKNLNLPGFLIMNIVFSPNA